MLSDASMGVEISIVVEATAALRARASRRQSRRGRCSGVGEVGTRRWAARRGAGGSARSRRGAGVSRMCEESMAHRICTPPPPPAPAPLAAPPPPPSTAAAVAKMASHAIFQYNVLAINDTHNTWTNIIVKINIPRLLGSSDDKEKIGVARPSHLFVLDKWPWT